MGVSGSVRQGNVFEVQPVGDYSSDKVCEVYMVPLADYNQMEGGIYDWQIKKCLLTVWAVNLMRKQ